MNGDEQTWDVEAQFGWLTRSAPLISLCSIAGAVLLAGVLSYGTGSILSKPNPTLILYPVFAMFVLVFLVLSRMGEKRIGGVKRGEINIAFYRTFSAGAEPEPMQAITRNFINLFEMPVLFYVGVIFTYITHQVNYWMVGLAWAYVALRYVHTYVHLTSNTVVVRLAVYLTSGIVLCVLWGTLLVQLLLAEA